MHIIAHDYYTDAPLKGCSLEALSGLIDSQRAQAQEQGGLCVLLDNGDLLQGTPLADYLANADTDTDAEITAHPAAQVMDALGYDALGVGNHDLDYGLPYLVKFARDLQAPLVSSNLHLNGPADWLHQTVLLEKGGLRIGVLSVLPKRTEIWSHTSLTGLATISDMTRTCRAAAEDLRAQGADLVIALAHTGIGKCADENALEMIAKDGAVDALIGGHTHKRWPEHAGQHDLHGVPTVMPGHAAETLGQIDLTVTRTPQGQVEIAAHNAVLLPAPTITPPSKAAFSPLKPAHIATRSALGEILGSSEAPLTSYMAQVQPTRMLETTAAAMQDALDQERGGTAYADLPMLCAVSPARAGGAGGPTNYADIAAGPLRRRQIAEFHVFQDEIWGVPASGKDLRNWLEKSAAAFSLSHDIAKKGLLSPNVPGFDFDAIYGLTYEINPLAPPRFDKNGKVLDATAQRIENLRFQGALVSDADRFLVATSSFRACGGGMFPGLSPRRDLLRTSLHAADVMRSFIASGRAVARTHPWRFSDRAAGTQTWFETGPGAKDHLSDIAHLSPQPQALTQDGFLRIAITL